MSACEWAPPGAAATRGVTRSCARRTITNVSAEPSAPDTGADRRPDGRRTAAAARRRTRQAQIIEATRRLLDQRGAGDAQIEDVARAVGVNRAIIYRHFSGKEEIFALVVAHYLDDLRERLAAVPTDSPPAARIEAQTRAFVGFGRDHPAFIDCAYALMRRPGPELLDEISESALLRLGRAITGCLALSVAALDAGKATGDVTVEDTTLLANTLYATLLGGMQLARVGMLVTEAAPGVPSVATLSAEEVGDHLVRSVLAMARG